MKYTEKKLHEAADGEEIARIIEQYEYNIVE